MSQEAIKQAIAQFPEVFGIRAFPGQLFTINERASYVGSDDVVQLYVFFYRGPEKIGKAFAKATVEELEEVITR